jgi:fatty-acid peroxygenase
VRIPRDRSPDSTLALLRDPYRFIARRCRRYRSDVFQTRILLRGTICMSGQEAARVFYNPGYFMREGAAPGRIQKTLFGRGGVQALDGEEHRHRKRMLMSLMTPAAIARLGDIAAAEWGVRARRWTSMQSVVLYEELQRLLTRAACEWAGVPLPEPEIERRSRQLSALFDSAASVGPRHWYSRFARKRAESWIMDLVAEVRDGWLHPYEGSALHAVAHYRDPSGRLLRPREAAVEVLNILRPTVAVAVYIVFAAHALYRHPECRARLRSGERNYADFFVQEVRRFYPFFPAVMARVRHDFEWNGYVFPKGRRAMLDLYGTNHDARNWPAPEEFRPERFRSWNGNSFNFIPQGGGDYHANHRCPGEWITMELMRVALDFLVNRIRYEVPEQDLEIDCSRLPALPGSRFIIVKVRKRRDTGAIDADQRVETLPASHPAP